MFTHLFLKNKLTNTTKDQNLRVTTILLNTIYIMVNVALHLCVHRCNATFTHGVPCVINKFGYTKYSFIKLYFIISIKSVSVWLKSNYQKDNAEA